MSVSQQPYPGATAQDHHFSPRRIHKYLDDNVILGARIPMPCTTYVANSWRQMHRHNCILDLLAYTEYSNGSCLNRYALDHSVQSAG